MKPGDGQFKKNANPLTKQATKVAEDSGDLADKIIRYAHDNYHELIVPKVFERDPPVKIPEPVEEDNDFEVNS